MSVIPRLSIQYRGISGASELGSLLVARVCLIKRFSWVGRVTGSRVGIEMGMALNFSENGPCS